MSIHSENFPSRALDPVTNNSASNLFTNGDSQARSIQSVHLPDDKKAFGTNFIRRIKKFQKFGTSSQANMLWKRADIVLTADY